MKKYTEEKINYMNQNKDEIVNFISSNFRLIDKELKLRKDEILSIPTKEGRIKKVKEISKELLNGKH